MDLLRLIKSLEELLYEVVTWLLFYPRTLWLALTRPSALAIYTDVELAEDLREQFTDVVSPPLFLLLSLLLAHAAELALHQHLGPHKSDLANKIFETDTNLLIFRSVVYSVFPLLMANGLLRRLGQPVDRKTLRRPFFMQCFFAAPLVILTSAAGILLQLVNPLLKLAGAVLWIAAVAWYLGVETHWFRTLLGIGRLRAFGIALKLFLIAFLIGLVVALAIVAPEMGDAITKVEQTTSTPETRH